MRLTPDDLSSAPTLIWTEFDPDFGEFGDFYGMESAGGGRILRRLYRGPAVPIRLIVTTDGVEWSELPLPNGFHLATISSDADATIDVAGDRWVAFGQDVTDDPHENVGREIWFSDDQGSRWVEANIEVPQKSEPLPPYATEESAVLEALASGDRLVAVVRTSTRLDLEALLADRGLLPARKDLVNWVPSRDGVKLTFADELPPDGESARRGRDRHRLQELKMSYKDLRLSAEQQELLRRRKDTVIRIYTGDSPSLQLSAEYQEWAYKVTGAASAEGIVLATQGNWEALLTSTDGRAWTEVPLGAVELWATGGDGALWAATRTSRGTRIDRIRSRDGRATVAFLETIENFSSFSAGPAGVVAAAPTGDSASASEPALMKSMRRAGKTHRGHGSYRSSEVWVGWSADGAAWGWQSASEAFGIDRRGSGTVALAVGRDFVLAQVRDTPMLPKPFASRPIDFDGIVGAGWVPAALPPPRWFIARVR